MDPLVDELLCAADTKWVLAHWYIKVLPNARRLDDFTAIAALLQEELGHVRALFSYIEQLANLNEHALEFDRCREDIHSIELLDKPPGSWPSFVVSSYVIEQAVMELLGKMEASQPSLQGLGARIAKEERYHRMYWIGSLESLADDERTELSQVLAPTVSQAASWLGSFDSGPVMQDSSRQSSAHRSEGASQSSGSLPRLFVERLVCDLAAIGTELDPDQVLESSGGHEGRWDARRRRSLGSALPQALFDLMVPTSEIALLARRPRREESRDELIPAMRGGEDG